VEREKAFSKTVNDQEQGGLEPLGFSRDKLCRLGSPLFRPMSENKSDIEKIRQVNAKVTW
jgi:uncharacterized protein (DUF2141 family)